MLSTKKCANRLPAARSRAPIASGTRRGLGFPRRRSYRPSYPYRSSRPCHRRLPSDALRSKAYGRQDALAQQGLPPRDALPDRSSNHFLHLPRPLHRGFRVVLNAPSWQKALLDRRSIAGASCANCIGHSMG